MWTAFARTHYERLNTRYASDVTDDEFGLIEPLLPPAKRGGRRRTADLREVLNAILYLIRTGWPWPGFAVARTRVGIAVCFQHVMDARFFGVYLGGIGSVRVSADVDDRLRLCNIELFQNGCG